MIYKKKKEEKMDFIIIYERKIRELENALLLKLELEKRGYLCGVYQYYGKSVV